MYKLQKKSNGQLIVYLMLLGATIGAMASLKRCQFTDGEAISQGCAPDTLKVAMQFAPGSLYADADGNLRGADYEALKQLKTPFRIIPINNVEVGLRGLDAGRYDIVIGNSPVDSLYKVLLPTDSSRCKPWVFKPNDTALIKRLVIE